MKYRLTISATVCVIAICTFAGGSAAAAPPNLIAICTDDQARWAMGAYGNSEVKTPHMDRIAADGALFENAFCNTPVCSPSRASYLTGLWPSELKITDWINPNEAANGVGLSAATWPQALQQAGYSTAMIGKWHLGEQQTFHPTKKGFDHFMGFLAGGNRPMNPTLEVDGKVTKLKGSLPDLLTDDAIDWLGRQKTDIKPFALCLHFRAPHGPFLPVPAEDRKPYDTLDPKFIPTLKGLDQDYVKRQHREYYSSVASVDRNIGRLLKQLDDTGLTDNTIVLFTSDHGYNLGRHYVSSKGNGIWQGGGRISGAPNRPNMWDTSLRVPLAIRWPGVIKPGTRISQTVSFIDFYKTMLGMLDVPVPANASPRGIDFSPLLKNQPIVDQPYLYGQYDLHNSGLAYLRMVRSTELKYVRHFHSNYMDELYDLKADPDESKNLLRRNGVPQHLKAEVARMKLAMEQWMQSINDPLSTTLSDQN